VPFALVHAVPQVPHVVTAFRSVSQPSASSPLQLPHPAAHAIEHVPPEHDGVA
jgi:hypothetical protein